MAAEAAMKSPMPIPGRENGGEVCHSKQGTKPPPPPRDGSKLSKPNLSLPSTAKEEHRRNTVPEFVLFELEPTHPTTPESVSSTPATQTTIPKSVPGTLATLPGTHSVLESISQSAIPGPILLTKSTDCNSAGSATVSGSKPTAAASETEADCATTTVLLRAKAPKPPPRPLSRPRSLIVLKTEARPTKCADIQLPTCDPSASKSASPIPRPKPAKVKAPSILTTSLPPLIKNASQHESTSGTKNSFQIYTKPFIAPRVGPLQANKQHMTSNGYKPAILPKPTFLSDLSKIADARSTASLPSKMQPSLLQELNSKLRNVATAH